MTITQIQATPPAQQAAAHWRRPTEVDKKRKKLLARNQFEAKTFSVQWNEELKCWALYGFPHILMLVSEVCGKKAVRAPNPPEVAHES
jgi:hypothetical protein